MHPAARPADAGMPATHRRQVGPYAGELRLQAATARSVPDLRGTNVPFRSGRTPVHYRIDPNASGVAGPRGGGPRHGPSRRPQPPHPKEGVPKCHTRPKRRG